MGMFTVTPEERRIVVFILSMFVLGTGAKHCRERARNGVLISSLPSPHAPAATPAKLPPAKPQEGEEERD
jgi:hypothetical protein